MRCIHLSAAALLVCLSSPYAFGIDCSKAAVAAEKLICADPALVRLDGELNAAYAELQAQLEDPHQGRLRYAQKEWLAARNELAANSARQPRKANLDTMLQERIAALRGAIVSINTLRFLRLEGYRRPLYLLTELPGTAAYNRWVDEKVQEAMAEDRRAEAARTRPGCGDDCEPHEYVGRVYALDFASPELLSVHESVIYYSRGAAHPSNVDVHHNWWLAKPGVIAPAEIFAGSGYRRAIAKQVAQFYKDLDQINPEQQRAATQEASKPANWGIRADALHVTGQGYDYGVGRGFVEIDIPWTEFGRGLNADFKARLQRHAGATPALYEHQ